MKITWYKIKATTWIWYTCTNQSQACLTQFIYVFESKKDTL